jgi:HK97 gp10 family phage protein
MAMQVVLTGVAEMKRQLDALGDPKATARILGAGLSAGAQAIRDEAKARAPVRAVNGGALRDSIIAYRDRKPPQGQVHYMVGVKRIKLAYTVNRLNRRLGRAGLKLKIREDAFYWRFLEYGTAKMHARPFMQPAIAAVSSKLVDMVGAKIQAGIDRAIKRQGK